MTGLNSTRKAWVAGILSALLNPLLTLLSGTDVLNLRTLVVALLSGALAAAAVWAVDNAEPVQSSPRSPVVGATTPATDGVAAPAQTAPVDVVETTDFTGQSVAGE